MTVHRYETYGWKNTDVDGVAREVEQALSIEFEPRSSLYRGEYYRWHGDDRADIILQENVIEEDDGLPTDDEHPEHVVLLYASRLQDEWFDRLTKIPGAERLTSTVTPEP
jgi:hypothetical protein